MVREGTDPLTPKLRNRLYINYQLGALIIIYS